MAKQAVARAKLTLDDNQFQRGMRRAIGSAKEAGKQIGGVAKGAAAFGAAIVGVNLAGAGLRAIGDGIHSIFAGSIKAAAQMEDFKATFQTFLGSAGKATGRLEELRKFAQSTPFDLPEVVEASKNLEVLTKGALASGEGLKMIGDIAAATNRDFSETATNVGRLYANLRAGQNIGQELNSLRDTGALSPEAARKISAAAGMDGARAWRIAQQELSRFDGLMQTRSGTWNGLMSNFRDAIQQAMAKFGEPLIKALKPSLALLSDTVEKNGPALVAAGEKFAGYISTAAGALQTVLASKDPVEALGKGLNTAMDAAGKALKDKAGEALKNVAKDFLYEITHPFSPRKDFMLNPETGTVNPPPANPVSSPSRGALMGATTPAKKSPLEFTGGEFPTASRFEKFAAAARSRLSTGSLGPSASLFQPLPGRLSIATKMTGLDGFGAGTGGRGMLGAGPSIGGGPTRSTSLLSVAQRRSMEQQVRVAAMGEQFLKTGSFDIGGKHASGDRRKAMEYVKRQTLANATNAKDNAIAEIKEKKFDGALSNIEGILKVMKEAWLMKGGK